MLTGKDLGRAIGDAIKRKGVSQAQVARHFGVKPPSISDWINRGTIRKDRIDELVGYFSDVVGPEHWGIGSYRVKESRAACSVRPHHDRLMVQRLCELAEKIDDTGLTGLIEVAQCFVKTHPLRQKPKAA